jgi:Na+-transporting NADH:ubiquinone oxidoreductase subunit B
MATDPISAPKQETSKYIYGALIGIVAIIIRSFSLFTEGIMFAILIVNAFVPLIDRNIKIIKDRKKAGKKVTA